MVPGLVDGHTHPVWAGDRVAEFALKLAGATYMQVSLNIPTCRSAPYHPYMQVRSFLTLHAGQPLFCPQQVSSSAPLNVGHLLFVPT